MVLAFTLLVQSHPCRAEERLTGLTGADAPLSLLQTFEGTYGVAYAGKATYLKRGNATFNLAIPGTPVAAWLYLAGTDVRTEPGEHFPAGDADVHNAIVVSGYDLNHPEGAFAIAVYSSPALARTRTEIFDGADRAWYRKAPPLGPDTEAVISTFAPHADGPRDGRVLLVTGGAQPRRGDEVFLFTGAGDPDVLIPCSDGDGLPDITDRRWRLTRRDAPPRGNDRANSGIRLEALGGAISLEEDKLGVLRKHGGRSLGPELDMISAPFVIPAGHSFSAFQIQSEDPEPGDKLTLYLAVNTYEAPEVFNPLPNIIVTKEPKLSAGAPGLTVDFTFTVTAAGGDEALENVQLSDEPFLAITGPDPAGDFDADGELDPGEAWAYHATATFTAAGEFPDVVTATGTGVDSGLDVSDTDDALVIVTPPPEPDFTLEKRASIGIGAPGDIVAYEFTLTNTGGIPLVGLDVVDDVLGDLGRVTVGVGETVKLHVDFHPLPECGQGGATLNTGCGGEALETGACSLTNTVTATWGESSWTARECVEIRTPVAAER